MNVILHIITHAAWNAAQQRGNYRPASLDIEGVIHCSTPQQVLGPANAFYRGQHDLVLLVIDPAKLHADLRYEAADGELFPHIYGSLNLDAVLDVVPFPPQADGTFTLPKFLVVNEHDL